MAATLQEITVAIDKLQKEREMRVEGRTKDQKGIRGFFFIHFCARVVDYKLDEYNYLSIITGRP